MRDHYVMLRPVRTSDPEPADAFWYGIAQQAALSVGGEVVEGSLVVGQTDPPPPLVEDGYFLSNPPSTWVLYRAVVDILVPDAEVAE